MSAEVPDPRTFKTWDDAFQHPIPVVRKLEQQLRSNADENREKLRSLVGASYRSLLDTAETIIDMEVRMENVETKLSRVGKDCNSSILSRISGNASGMDAHLRATQLERYTFASQLAVLRNAPTVMTRLMKGDINYLLIAKLLVISRLLHKALSQAKNKGAVVDSLWEKLLSMRRKLLRRIDKRFASASGDTAGLVESMCAYALATSSTPTDVLHHFHKIRLERITSSLKKPTESLTKNGIDALQLCLQTCQDTQTIFPRRLADSLAKLKAQPLVQDPDVRSLYELNLEIHDRWIGDEAKNYTPQPRHDELQRADADRILHRWSRDAISAFIKGVQTSLENEHRLNETARLREELIEMWILSGGRMSGVKSANVLDDLRDTMNDKLEDIVRARAQNLKGVVDELNSIVTHIPSQSSSETAPLWAATSASNDLNNGATQFKSRILNAYQGRNDSVLYIVSSFDGWMQSVLEVKGIVKSMKEARWDDTFAEEDMDEEEELEDNKQTLLSDDDPKLLEDATLEALSACMTSLGKSLEKLVSGVATPFKDIPEKDSVQKAVFILRVTREIGDRIPQLRVQDKSSSLTSPFTSNLLRPLHAGVSAYILDSCLHSCQQHYSASLKIKTKSHILWEGSPGLPVQPSPYAFRFLKELERRMAELGADLWVQESVSVLKQRACQEVSKIFSDHFQSVDKIGLSAKKRDQPRTSQEPADEASDDAEPHSNNEKSKGVDEELVDAAQVEEQKDQKRKQALFDLLYVQRFVGGTDGTDAMQKLFSDVGRKHTLDETVLVRLRKNAGDYAKKTYLLFALLT